MAPKRKLRASTIIVIFCYVILLFTVIAPRFIRFSPRLWMFWLGIMLILILAATPVYGKLRRKEIRESGVRNKRPWRVWLESQDPTTKKIINFYILAEAAAIIGLMAIILLAVNADIFFRLFRWLFTNKDSAYNRFFILNIGTPIPLILCSTLVISLIFHTLIPKLPTKSARIWSEYVFIKFGGSKSYRRGIAFLGIVISILLLSFILLLGSYTKVTDNGIAFSRFTGDREQFHNWKSISRIKRVDKISKKHRIIYYIVYFSDETKWRSPNSNPLTAKHLEPAMEYIQSRTGREIQTINR